MTPLPHLPVTLPTHTRPGLPIPTAVHLALTRHALSHQFSPYSPVMAFNITMALHLKHRLFQNLLPPPQILLIHTTAIAYLSMALFPTHPLTPVVLFLALILAIFLFSPYAPLSPRYPTLLDAYTTLLFTHFVTYGEIPNALALDVTRDLFRHNISRDPATADILTITQRILSADPTLLDHPVRALVHKAANTRA